MVNFIYAVPFFTIKLSNVSLSTTTITITTLSIQDCWAECLDFIVVLSDVMLNAVMLSVMSGFLLLC
jgi:hypothetical protein